MEPTQIILNSHTRYQDDRLEVDFHFQAASVDGQRLKLTRKEFELLAALVESAGQVVHRNVLLMRVWGYSDQIRTRTLDVHIRRLRIKLGAEKHRCLETIFSIGYRYQPFRKPAESNSPALALTA